MKILKVPITMHPITKINEPNALIQYRKQIGAVYDGANFTPVKDSIRMSLLLEQGYLCAYCMQRIDVNSMKVEHWHCQSIYPNEQLYYGNLLGCCKGNESSTPKEQHCDTKKADNDISLNPANQNHHQHLQIQYFGDGRIYSLDNKFNNEIDKILNLNLPRLKANRESVIKAVYMGLSKKGGQRSAGEIMKLIRKWIALDANGQHYEFFHVAIYFLEKKYAQR